jgi:membrane-associated phospholipid phosphatase
LVAALVAALAAAVSSCGGGKVPQSEPTGGTWKPVLLASVDAIDLPAPPDASSAEQRQENDELLALQKERKPEQEATAKFWDAGASVRWNEIARDLVAKHRTNHPMASRAYALLSVAQYDALVAAWNKKYSFKRPRPEKAVPTLHPLLAAPPDPAYPSAHAAVASASATVLAYLYPDEAASLEAKASEDEMSRLSAGVSYRSDIVAGQTVGRSVGRIVIDRAGSDGSDAPWSGKLPRNRGQWFSAPNEEPLLPQWGHVRPWLMPSTSDFAAPPPPAYDSPEFRAALAEVRNISDHRTPEQARIAALWADGLGSYSPAGRWNKVAADLIQKYQFDELRAARAFALLNMAMADAEIACWDTKYRYLVIRPPQADPAITTPVGLPNFPSYPSSHACLSGAGAETLGYLFPHERASLSAKSEEAARSRVYGGIHYTFDGVAGLALGHAVARLAIDRGSSDGSP